MTISTYAELKTAIQSWFMDRSDVVTAAGDEIIALAEGYFNLNLRCREMETIVSLTPVLNVCTIPSTYIEYKRVVEKASIRRPLEYITEDAADDYYPTRSAALSCHYMIVGSDLTALPLSSNDIELTYYRTIPALTSLNTTNWLLTKSPNLYLHTCLMYAAEFVKDTDELARESAFVGKFIDLLNAANNRAKFGNAGMTMRGVIW